MWCYNPSPVWNVQHPVQLRVLEIFARAWANGHMISWLQCGAMEGGTNALFNKERRGDLRVATRTVLSIFCWLTCFFPPCRKMRACNHDMFQLPSGILGKSWFGFLCQLRPKVSEVSQLFAHEAHSWEPGSWGGARVWAVGQVRSAGAVESEMPTPGSAP